MMIPRFRSALWYYCVTRFDKCHVLDYQSRKSRRVLRFALAAEVFVDAAYMMASDLNHTHGKTFELLMLTDSPTGNGRIPAVQGIENVSLFVWGHRVPAQSTTVPPISLFQNCRMTSVCVFKNLSHKWVYFVQKLRACEFGLKMHTK